MDEKKAFDEMLAEIAADDSSEEDSLKVRRGNSFKRPQSGNKLASGNNIVRESVGKDTLRKDSLLGSADSKSSYLTSTNGTQNQYKKASTNTAVINRYQLSKEEQDIENFGTTSRSISNGVSSIHQDATSHNAQAPLSGEQVTVSKRWLTKPVSRSERRPMQCYIERERQGFAQPTIYRCYLETPDQTGGQNKPYPPQQAQQPAKFMMSAKKRTSKKSNNYYLISLDVNPNDDKGSESVLGKVRSNNVGSRYLITDNGLAPDKTVAPSMIRKEFGVVSFEFDSGGPSRIDAWVPPVSASGQAGCWQPDNESSGIEAAVDALTASGGGSSSGSSGLFYLQNKPPKWDEAHGGHVLNFQGRVTESSVKNFQLVCINSDLCDAEDIALQFGRVGKHRFTMDLKYPLSPMQAFSICVACLDGKIADRKGYEYIKKIAGSVSGTVAGGPTQEFYGSTKPADLTHVDSEAQVQSRGNLKGSSSLSGSIMESMPSTQYLRDKINRSFK